MSDIINDKINFIINEFTSVEYTWFNTIMFGIILVIALFFVIKLMKKLKIEIDKNFVLALIPFILFGSTMRALADAEIYPHRPDVLAFLFIAPGIYFTIFLIAVASLFIGLYIFKKKYYKFMLVAGCLLFGLNLVLIAVFLYSHSATANFGAFIVFLIFAMWAIIIYAIIKLNPKFSIIGGVLVILDTILIAVFSYSHFFSNTILDLFVIFLIFSIPLIVAYVIMKMNSKFPDFLKYEKNYIIVLAHFFDTSTTYVGIAFFSYFEKHVLPSAAIEIFSPAIMFVLKFIVIPALYFIDKIDDKTTRRMIKIVIFILGISPAIRNFTRILLGV